MIDPNSNRPLIQGIDYYVEAGRWVFTAAYHLRRGACCESGCRHCPYRPNESSAVKPVADSNRERSA